jgi:hypothetical protein
MLKYLEATLKSGEDFCNFKQTDMTLLIEELQSQIDDKVDSSIDILGHRSP